MVAAPALILDAPANHLHATVSDDVSSISVEADKIFISNILKDFENTWGAFFLFLKLGGLVVELGYRRSFLCRFFVFFLLTAY